MTTADGQTVGRTVGRPSRRRLGRLASVLLLDGFRAAPGWMTVVTAMLVVGMVAATCYPLGLPAAGRRRAGRIVGPDRVGHRRWSAG